MDGVGIFMGILMEVLVAIGRFFINPLLYIAIIVAIGLGYFRVKRERHHFNTRIVWGWSELRSFWKEALFIAFFISCISVAVGLTVTSTFLVILTIISVIGLMTFCLPFLSPSYLVASTVAFIWWINQEQREYDVLGLHLEGVDIFEGLIVTVSVFVGLLLIAEGLLIRRTARAIVSPIVENSRRGLRGITFKTKRVWLLPIMFVIPGDTIAQFFPYWPQFSLGTETFSLVIFPFVIGFSQFARRTLPMYLLPRIGQSVATLGMLVLATGIGSLFFPLVGVGALGLAVIGRLLISITFAARERSDIYAVAPRATGAVIAAVLPESPAEKMGLKVGETIKKVNGVPVYNTFELYEALQFNAAHCRLEVLDHQNELRLTQHVVYSHDHHKIGLLIVE